MARMLVAFFIVAAMVGPNSVVAKAEDKPAIPADELVVLRAENNLLRQQAFKRDAQAATEQQQRLDEVLRAQIRAAAIAAGLDPDAYVLVLDKRQWVPKPAPATPPAVKP